MTYSPVPILEQLGVALVPTGKKSYRCACPIHRGDHLSMALSLRDARWQITCFACGFSGSTYDFVMALRDCTFSEAARYLEDNSVGDEPPVELFPPDYYALVCDRCGNATKVEGSQYKVPGRTGSIWESTPIEEVFAMESRGWVISARADFAICPTCLS